MCAEAYERWMVQSEKELRIAVAVWLHTRRSDDADGIVEALKVLEPIQNIEWVGTLVEELRDRYCNTTSDQTGSGRTF